MKKIKVNNLQVNEDLIKFVNEEAVPGTNLDKDKFWKDFDEAVHTLTPVNKKLLQNRNDIQKRIDEWHLQKKGTNFNRDEYFNFGYVRQPKTIFNEIKAVPTNCYLEFDISKGFMARHNLNQENSDLDDEIPF